MRRSLIWNSFLIIASTLNYALAYVLRIIWGIDLYYFLLIVFIFSFMLGLVTVNLERIIIFSGISLLLGSALGSVLIISPTIVAGESMIDVNLAIITTLHIVLAHLLFNSVVGFLGAVVGFVFGERFTRG